MMNALIAWSLRHRPVALGLAALVLGGGVWTAARMPVDVLPDLTAPTVTVLAEAHGMAPEEVETLVTFPIETAVNGATGVRRVRSSTAPGIAVIWVEFDWGVDMFRARQIVTEKLQTVAGGLPAGLPTPVLAPISSVMGEIMMVGLTGPQAPDVLRAEADWTVRRRLLAVPGVAQVIPIGGAVREYQVLPDPARMAASSVTLDQVLVAARGANVNAAGGVTSAGGREYLVRGLGRLQDVADLGNTVVVRRDATPILLRQVAEVRLGVAPRFGDGSVNGEPGVVLAIQKQPDANTLALTRAITAVLGDVQATLPEGMTVHTDLFRQADFIRVAVDNVIHALRDGAILVVIVLIVFLANVRATAISLVAIPLSLAASVFALRVLGISINTMTLGGMAIAVGVLVDDAIIDVENVFRRLRERAMLPEPARRPVLAVVYEASVEIRASIVNATLIIMLAFLPLFFLGGVEGRLLRPLGIAYTVAILASLIVAVTVTPALCALLLPNTPAVRAGREGAVVRRLKAWYRPVLGAVLRRPRTVIAGAVVALGVAVSIVPLLGTAFLPAFNEGALTVSVVTVPGTALDEANRIGRRVEQMLLAEPGVRTTDRRQGRADLDEHAQGVNAAEIDVTLHEHTDRDALLERLRRAFTMLPGTNVTIGQPIGHRVDHLLSGTRANIAINIFGPDLLELRRLGTRVRDAITAVPGVADLQLEQQSDVPQIRIRGNRALLAARGLTPGDLAETVDVGFNGEPVSQVLEEGRAFDLVVRFPESWRRDPAVIAALPVAVPGGGTVPLGQLADVSTGRGPNTISRENAQRKIVVQANVAGRDLGNTVADIRTQLATLLPLPAGYHLDVGGQFQSQEQATRTIAFLSALAILGMFVILWGEFRSGRDALLVMVNLPLALIGGVVAVALTDGIVSIASLVGFVTLFGISARNGILLVAHYRHLMEEGAPLEEAVVRGSQERLAPILMTALAAGLALLPLALGGGEPGNELQTPLAVVVLGGLLSSTALNMVVLPALYARFGRVVVTTPAGGDGLG